MIQPKLRLYPFQQTARDMVLSEWGAGRKKTLLVLPTGSGKTVVFASIIDDSIRDGSRALILAHRDELLEQARDKLMRFYGLHSALEKANTSSLGSPLKVTVGSIQSFSQTKRLSQFPKDYFHTIIVDEAHHALSKSYQRVLKHFSEANVLGVTATPDRGDKKLLSQYFDSQAYEYTMDQAIKDGYLCPISALTLKLQIDLQNVRVSNGDFEVNDLDDALSPYLRQIAVEIKSHCAGRRTVVFLPLIKTSQKFCRILNEEGINAREVNGESEDRKQILEDFHYGRFDVLCNSMLLTEGWDERSVDCIIVLRPTQIRSLYQQMIGRGTRLCPETGKKDLLILDFLWLYNIHNLCRPSTLVSKDETIAGYVDEMLNEDEDNEKERKPRNLSGLVKMAEDKVVKQREIELAKKLAGMRSGNEKMIDPLQLIISCGAEDLLSYKPTFKWESEKPTEKQLKFLQNRGIFTDTIKTSGSASLLIGRLLQRQKENLCTPKQIRVLEKKGFISVGTWSFEAASQMIQKIADNNWRIPDDIDVKSYQPPKPQPKLKPYVPEQMKLW